MIGSYEGSRGFDGQMSNIHFLDGVRLDASHFGYTDPLTGTWRPKTFAGDYQSNGINTFTSGTGQGKSTITREIATHLLNKGERVGFLDLEASNRQTALGLMSTAVGKALHIGEHSEEEDDLREEEEP